MFDPISDPNAVPKVHPLEREMLPEDPLHMQAFEVPGDTELMCRVVIEEFARMGYDEAAILELARNPFYSAVHGLWCLYGEVDFRDRVQQVLSRVGVVRVRAVMAPSKDDLVQIKPRTT